LKGHVSKLTRQTKETYVLPRFKCITSRTFCWLHYIHAWYYTGTRIARRSYSKVSYCTIVQAFAQKIAFLQACCFLVLVMGESIRL